MSNPQKENGFWQIANEVDESLYVYDFSKTESQLLRFILRVTYGFKQTERRLSLDYLADGTGIKKTSVKRAMDNLIDKKVIIEIEPATRRKARLLKFNKYHDQWGVKKTGMFISELADKYPGEFRVHKMSTQSTQNEYTEEESSVHKMSTPRVHKMSTQSTQNEYSQSTQNEYQLNTSNTDINTGKDKEPSSSTSSDTNPLIDTDYKELVDYWQTNVLNGVQPSPAAMQDIGDLKDIYGKQLVTESFKITAEKKKVAITYASAILKNWKAEGIRTVEQLEAKNEAAAAKQNSNVIDWEEI